MTVPLDVEAPAVAGALPRGWRWARLGDVCEARVCARDPRSAPDVAFQYVDISSVDNKRKRIAKVQRLLGQEAPSRARQVIRYGDVLVSTTRPNLNAVAVVPPELDKQICSTGFCVLRPKPGLDSTFLFMYVQRPAFVESLSNLVRGALYPAVTDSQVRAQWMPLPPEQEQRRIAAALTDRLAAVDRMRAVAEARLAAAEALPAACLRAVFDGDEARAWPRKRVAELCASIDYGHTTSADFKVTDPRFLRITDIQDGHVDWRRVPGCRISPADEVRKSLADGDIVFARTGGTTGKSFLIRQPPRAVFASYLIRLRANGEIFPDYLYAFFQSDEYWRQVRASTRGGAQPNVNATLLGNIVLPVAPLSDQKRVAGSVAKQLAEVRRELRGLAQQHESIDELPAALLRQAFTGKL